MLVRAFQRLPARRFASSLTSVQTALLSNDFSAAENTFLQLNSQDIRDKGALSTVLSSHRGLVEHFQKQNTASTLDTLFKLEKKLYELGSAGYDSIVAFLKLAIQANEPEKGIELWVSYLEALGQRTRKPIPVIITKPEHLQCSLLALTCYLKACKKGGVEISSAAAASIVPLSMLPTTFRAVKLGEEDLKILDEGLKYLRANREDFGSEQYLRLIQSSTYEETRILYNEAIERKEIPEAVWAEFIRRFGETRQTSLATTAWNTMIKRGIKPTVASWNSLLRVTSLMKVDALPNFEAIWAKMTKSVKPNPQSYGIKIACLSHNQRYQDVLDLFNEIRKDSENVDIFVINNVLNSLLAQKLFNSALSLLDWAKKNGIKANIVSYNDILRAGLESDPDVADKVLTAMTEADIRPDIITYSQILQHVFKQGQKQHIDVMNRVESIMETMEGNTAMNAQFLTILADGISKTNPDIHRIRKIFEKIKSTNPKIHIATFGAFIEAELRHGDLNHALAIFDSIKKYGLPINVPTYTQMINGALRKGQAQVALDIWNQLATHKSQRANPTVWTYMFILNHSSDQSAAYKELLSKALERLGSSDTHLIDFRLAANILKAMDHASIPNELESVARTVVATDLDLSMSEKNKIWRR